MNEVEFNNLIDKDKYQVLLFKCKAHFPLHFADHIWFVVNEKGTISRWEVLYKAGLDRNHVHKDFLPSFKGIAVFNFSNVLAWKSELLHMIEGDENSTAKSMTEFIGNSKETYPYKNVYSLMGPNSNTYIQWVLNHFPDFNFKLPNYVGKNYKR